jgi:L-fuconolactonase
MFRAPLTRAAPLAYVRPADLRVRDDVLALVRRGFVGVSMYVFTDDDAKGVDGVSDDVWAELEVRQLIVSVNAKGAMWGCFNKALERHPNLRLLVSHLGLPEPVQRGDALSEADAHERMSHVLKLAKHPGVHVKLSGFYAVALPAHEHPHEASHPLVRVLFDAFGDKRLLWGSDFPPVLDHASFKQVNDWEFLFIFIVIFFKLQSSFVLATCAAHYCIVTHKCC